MKTTSIIIISYNSAEFISDCLKSIFKTNGINNTNVIVWDNNSQDRTREIIENKFPTVTLLKSNKNLGFGSAVNQVVKKINSKYIVLLNPDTMVKKNWLEGLLQTFAENKKVGAVNSKTKIIINNEEYIQNAGTHLFYNGYGRDRGAVISVDHKQTYEKDTVFYNNLTKIDAFSGVSVMMYRELFVDLGGFDEHMFMYYEDCDLSIRIKKAGYNIYYQPKSELSHLHSVSSKEWSNFFIFQTELNHLAFVFKHYPLNICFIELIRYKMLTFYQLLKFKKRFFIRIKVLFKFASYLPYLINYRIVNK